MIEQINDIVKEYPSMYKLTYFNKPRSYIRKERKEKKEKEKTPQDHEDNIQRSVRRTRDMIFDYAKCNSFDLFVTFTFNKEKVDRYDLAATSKKMQQWLWRQQQKHNKQLRYIITHERHKDGAIHFHALIGNYQGELVKTNVIKNDRRVYNMTAYGFGWTNAQYLDGDPDKATAYICKYITKDMELISNSRRYWASKNLLKPTKSYNAMYDLDLYPDLRHQVFVNDALGIYEIPKK